MESASIEYTIRKECDLTRIGNLLDSKSYGIGMPMSGFSFECNQNKPFMYLIYEKLILRFPVS